MMTWPCFAEADVFLQFLLRLPHVVLVVGTYQGIADRFSWGNNKSIGLLSTADIFDMSQYEKYSTGVNNTMKDGWIPYICSGFKVLVLCMLSHCHTVMSDWREPSLMYLVPHVPFPTVTYQNVCLEKGRSTCYISFSPTYPHFISQSPLQWELLYTA